jgi:hypothetical protein
MALAGRPIGAHYRRETGVRVCLRSQVNPFLCGRLAAGTRRLADRFRAARWFLAGGPEKMHFYFRIDASHPPRPAGGARNSAGPRESTVENHAGE